MLAAPGFLLWLLATVPDPRLGTLVSHWRHRGDFALTVRRVDWIDPRGLRLEADLRVSRDITAVAHAEYQTTDRSDPVGRLELGGEPPSIGADGRAPSWTRTPRALRRGETYRVVMVWPDVWTTSRQSGRTVVLRLVEGPGDHDGALLREFRVAVDPDPDTLAKLEGKLFPVQHGGQWGYVNVLGKPVIPPQFDWAGEFAEGRAVVRFANRAGYIDDTGRVAIAARFLAAKRFSEGLAAVAPERTFGYIDRTGAVVIPFQFDHAHSFSEGLARVRRGDREGFIDRAGKIVIALRFERAADFGGGLAPVRIGEKWGFIDTTGTLVLEPQFDGFQPLQQGRWNVVRGDRWGVVDRSGRWQPE